MRMNYRELINREIADTLISLFRSILTSGRLPDCLKDFHEHDIAQAMEELDPDERRKLCGILGARLSADIFPYFDEPGLRLAELSPEFAAAVADAMDTDEAMEILDEVIAELGIHPKVARIDAELSKSDVLAAFRAKKIRPFETTEPLTEEAVQSCEHVVAQMGIQPFIRALEQGADIIMGGRAYDAAVIAAYPIWKGEDPGLSYHMGKIMECGTAVALPRESDGMLGILSSDSFVVFPADPNKRCRPDTVAAHTLYERSTPFTTEFPGGQLDMRGCTFTGVDARTVKVTGSRYLPASSLTIKLEGARLVGFRTICLAGIRDPFVLAGLSDVETKVRQKVERDLPQYVSGRDYRILFRHYGAGEVMKERDPERWTPKEIGLVIEVLSPQQDTANTVCALCRSAILHMGFEGRRANSGNLAFLYTPAEFPAPPCYEFSLYHLMEVDDLCAPFPIAWKTY